MRCSATAPRLFSPSIHSDRATREGRQSSAEVEEGRQRQTSTAAATTTRKGEKRGTRRFRTFVVTTTAHLRLDYTPPPDIIIPPPASHTADTPIKAQATHTDRPRERSTRRALPRPTMRTTEWRAEPLDRLTTRRPRPRRSPPARPRTPRPRRWRPGTAGTRTRGRSCWTRPR